MASVNKVILIGNLGRDPETRYTTERRRDHATSRIATTEAMEGQGERREAGRDRMAPRRAFRPPGRDRRRVSEEGPPGLRRGPAADAQVTGQGRPGPLHDRDRRRAKCRCSARAKAVAAGAAATSNSVAARAVRVRGQAARRPRAALHRRAAAPRRELRRLRRRYSVLKRPGAIARLRLIDSLRRAVGRRPCSPTRAALLGFALLAETSLSRYHSPASLRRRPLPPWTLVECLTNGRPPSLGDAPFGPWLAIARPPRSVAADRRRPGARSGWRGKARRRFAPRYTPTALVASAASGRQSPCSSAP